MGTQLTAQKRGTAPNFGACLLWPNGCMYQDTTRYGGRPQPWRHCVRCGRSSPPLKGHSPHFSANVRCGQTAGWTRKMPLGVEVGLGPGDIALDTDPAPPKERDTAAPHISARHSSPQLFGPLLWPASPQARILRITRAVRGGRLSWQSYRVISTRLVITCFYCYPPFRGTEWPMMCWCAVKKLLSHRPKLYATSI